MAVLLHGWVPDWLNGKHCRQHLSLSLYFLAVEAMCPAASTSCHRILPTMIDHTLKLWVTGILPSSHHDRPHPHTVGHRELFLLPTVIDHTLTLWTTGTLPSSHHDRPHPHNVDHRGLFLLQVASVGYFVTAAESY